jgi:4-carboxymuconolactone decarboxylase
VPRPSVPRIPPVQRVVERSLEQEPAPALVRPIHLGATLVHNKPVRAAIQAFSSVFFDPAQLEPRLRELLVLRMAWDTQSQYEWGQHVLAARAVGIGEQEIVAVSRPIGEGAWSQLEGVALQLVDDLHADDCVSDETWAELASMVDEHDLPRWPT